MLTDEEKQRFATDSVRVLPDFFSVDASPSTTEAVPLEATTGTLVLLAHWSAPDTSPASRHPSTLHIIEGDAHYPDDNWLQRSPTMPLRGIDPDR